MDTLDAVVKKRPLLISNENSISERLIIMDKIVDLRHRKHARKITITFCGNSIISRIYDEIKMEGYEISPDYIYSSKEKDSCVINMTVKRRNKSFDEYIAFLADKAFCKTIYIYDYMEVDDDY